MEITKTCLTCNKQFIAQKTSTKFCSRQCDGIAYRTKTNPDYRKMRQKECLVCHKPITVKVKVSREQTCCSHRCREKYWREKQELLNPRPHKTCLVCHKDFIVKGKAFQRQMFCSPICCRKSAGLEIDLEYRKYQKECLFCHKMFVPSVGQNKRKYCSYFCSRRGWAKENPEKVKLNSQKGNAKAREMRKLHKKSAYVKSPFCKFCGEKIPEERDKCGNEYCSDECATKNRAVMRSAYYRKTRLTVFNMLGGPVCKYCGCDDFKALELNHINGGGSKQQKHGFANDRIIWLMANGKMSTDGFEVTCRVCNAWHYITKKLGEDHWEIKWNKKKKETNSDVY